MAGLSFSPQEHERLANLVKAGRDGLALCSEAMPVSTAIRLEMAGMAEIRINAGLMRAVATPQGEAFLYRTVR